MCESNGVDNYVDASKASGCENGLVCKLDLKTLCFQLAHTSDVASARTFLTWQVHAQSGPGFPTVHSINPSSISILPLLLIMDRASSSVAQLAGGVDSIGPFQETRSRKSGQHPGEDP